MKLGFIGAGNMAAAIIGGLRKACDMTEIIVSDANSERLSFVAQKFGAKAASNIEVAQNADILFLAVKPNVYGTVIAEICEEIKPGAIVVSIAAGFSIADVREMFGGDVKLVKAMPNTPAMVNCGMTAICASENVSENELAPVLKIFESVGKVEILPERLFPAFTALAGSSPAYVFTFIEAMADAGVSHGLSRKQAQEIATQAVLGSAKYLQESDEHPASLRDAVASPGGTTIAAICELERTGFRSAIISAVDACVQKYDNM